jgi:putative membrane protein
VAELLLPWEPSLLTLLAMAAATVAYLIGARHTRPSSGRQILFWIGMSLFYVTLQTHADYYAEHAFSLGQVQHVLLHHMAPFLVVLAQPGVALLTGLPAPVRTVIQRTLAWPPLAIFAHPAVAGLLFCTLIIVWLVPTIHFYAMLDARLYRLMTLSMAINGLMFWQVALYGRATLASRMVMLLAVIPPQIALGVALTLADRVVYPLYSLCGLAFGLTPLDDQHLGGMAIWLSSGMMSAVALLIVVPKRFPKSVLHFSD